MSTPSPESSTRVSTDARAAMNAVLSELVVTPVQVAVRESAAGLATAVAVSDLRTRLDDVKRILNAELKSPDSELRQSIDRIVRFLDAEADDLNDRLAANGTGIVSAVAERHAAGLRENEERVGGEIRRAASDIRTGVSDNARQTETHVSETVGALGSALAAAVAGTREQILAGVASHADATVGRIEASAREMSGQVHQHLRDLEDGLGKAEAEARERHRLEVAAASERHVTTRGTAVEAVVGARQAVLDELGRAVAVVQDAVPRKTVEALSSELREIHEVLARLETGLTAMTTFAEQQRAWNDGTSGEVKALREGIGGHEFRLTEVAGALRTRLNATLGVLALLVAGGAALLWLLLR